MIFSLLMLRENSTQPYQTWSLLKSDKPPSELSKFQTEFKSNYDEEKKILLNGKNNTQEVSLKDAGHSLDLRERFFKIFDWYC